MTEQIAGKLEIARAIVFDNMSVGAAAKNFRVNRHQARRHRGQIHVLEATKKSALRVAGGGRKTHAPDLDRFLDADVRRLRAAPFERG